MRLYRGLTEDGKLVYGLLVYDFALRLGVGEWYKYLAIQIDDGKHIKVIPKTVGQSTGLKDKKSKKIYEGDIIDGEWEVRWWSDEAEFVLCNPIGEQNINTCAKEEFTKLSLVDSEIIGNIHQNPELLEIK